MSNVNSRQRIGAYRVVAPIGVGATSSVYRGLDEATGVQVAIKVLADNHSLVPSLRQRFSDEMKLLAAVDNPGVATIYDVGETDGGQPFMVLELADRGDLWRRVDDLVSRGQRLSPIDIEMLADHLADALGDLHRIGIVHRDVAPANILIASGSNPRQAAGDGGVLLGPDERFLLADLGLAKDLAFASGLTAGTGTKGFAAPEQQSKVTVIDHRADVYGATALISWAARHSDVEPALADFFDRGLADRPGDRHPTMAARREDLQSALDGASGVPGLNLRRPPRAVVLALTAIIIAVIAAATLAPSLGGNELETTGETTPVVEGPDEAAPVSQTTALVPLTPSKSSLDPGAGSGVQPTESSSVADSSTGASETATTSASTVSASTVSASTEPASTVSASTVSAPTASTATSTSTTAERIRSTTTTTFDAKFAESARAFVTSPGDETVVSGDLIIEGTVSYRAGVDAVDVVIRPEDGSSYWHGSSQRFERSFVQNRVVVSPPGADEASWTYKVDAEAFTPGRYIIRVWARGSDGTGDPVSSIVHFTVAD